MDSQEQQYEELLELAGDLCHGQITQEQLTRLESLLAGDKRARHVYLQYVLLHGELACSDVVLANSVLDLVHLDSHLKQTAIESPSPATARRQVGEPRTRRMHYALAASLLVAAAGLSWWSWPVPLPDAPGPFQPQLATLYYDDRSEPPAFVATVDRESHLEWLNGQTTPFNDPELLPGTVRLRQGQAKLNFRGGAHVVLDGPTIFGLDTENRATLFSGTIRARITQPGVKFTVDTPSLRVVDLGTEFTVHVNERGETEVRVTDGEVETQTRTRLPRFYWNFDATGGPMIDRVSLGESSHGSSIQRVPGLVGSGALRFDNSEQAYVDVGNGGGVKVGTGDFSASEGVTIETLILSQWSGKGHSTGDRSDYDEIFRKEDGVYRMLLSFQNNSGLERHEFPEVGRGPCLSFGLHLAGQGYQELDLLLDGLEGRPTLAELKDGRPHHIVATYDSWTGFKAIYIDGRERIRCEYSLGTMIISGGSAHAIIGNMWGTEPFTGVIDEMAFYEFALSADEVADHYQQTRRGANYFGVSDTSHLQMAGWRRVTLISEGQGLRFDAKTGLPLGEL